MAKDLKGASYALWKNPKIFTARQGAKLAQIAKTNHRLYRAYLLKEQLRRVFALKGLAGIAHSSHSSCSTSTHPCRSDHPRTSSRAPETLQPRAPKQPNDLRGERWREVPSVMVRAPSFPRS